MIRRTRLASLVLSAALAVTLVPASVAAADDGVPLRPSVRSQPDPNPSVVLRGRGWGHSVGMSQYGAYAMARAGRTHSQILQHYYPGTALGTYTGDQRVTVTAITGTPASTAVTAVGGNLQWVVCPPGATCANLASQPRDARWQLISGGSSNASRVTLCRRVVASADTTRASCPEADRVYEGNGTLELRLTDRDEFNPRAPVTSRVGLGSRQYAYGRLIVRGTGGNLQVDNLLPMEAYLRGLGEVPSSWGASGGQAALEAQAIIARTYVLARNRTTCATAACQVFVGYSKELEAGGERWVAAVRDPADRVLRYGNGYAQTYYSSSHGGRTEASEDSWAYGGAVPYLTSVDDPWSLEAPNPMRRWTAAASNAEFRRVTGTGLSRIERVEITARTPGGSPRTLRLTGPEGTREFSTTPTGARTDRTCNRNGYAGNSLRCDLATTVRNAADQPFAPAGGRPPSSQIRTIGFPPFTDDDGNTHEYAIVWAHAAGIAAGTAEPGVFAPRARVTRAQMASFIYRTFDIPPRTDRPFADVTGGPHADAIASVSAAGIARGYDARTFGPSDPVTREQMASFLARAMGLAPVRPAFDDVPPGGAHAGNVGAISQRGITAGCRGDSYCPRDPVTRDQMTRFLHRAVRSMR